MVDHDLLHTELAQFASFAAGNFDLHAALYQLSATAAAALDLEGAGVTLHMLDDDTEYLTATDTVALQVERQQDALQQGPCIDAIQSSEIVAVGDLRAETRWPEFRPVVLQAGFHSVAGVPVPFQGRNIGALNLYSATTRAWTTDDFAVARLVADLAAGYLVSTHLLGKSQALATQLQQALDTRVVIEQAKGVLAGRLNMTPDAAFVVMRKFARSSRIKVHDVARDVVSGEENAVGGGRTVAASHQGSALRAT